MRYYSLRFSLLPTVDFDERVVALLDFCDKAEIDDVMFFVAPEEVHVGHITLEQAQKYVDVIVKASKILKKKGITTSLNPWSTLVHYDGGRKLQEGQNFRTMVGADGTKASVAVCPLDENWRKYYVRLLDFYVKSIHPDVLWIEDDMRLSNHEPVSRGCFCDEHMRLYNEKTGGGYDRESFVKAIFTDKRARKAYLDVAESSVRETVEFIVDNLKEQHRFGLMTGGAAYNEGRKNGALFSVLAKNGKKPLDRLCLYSYRQRGSQEYAWSFNKHSMLARFAAGKSADCVSEAENFPDGYYTKSARYMRKQFLTSVPLCLMGDTLSIFEFCGNGVNNYERYAKVLREVKPYLSRVTDLGISPDEAIGVRVLVNENSAYSVKAKNFDELMPNDGWIFAYLTQLGVACAYTYDSAIEGQVVGVSGQVLRALDSKQVTALFEKNYVIITADNIAALKDMGLLHLIGARDYEVYRERTGRHTLEELATGEKIYGMSKYRATCQFFCGDYYNIDYDGNERAVTNVLDYNEKVVGKGVCESKNALIFPYENIDSDQNVPVSLLCALREHAIKYALAKNHINASELFFAAEENVCLYVFDKPDKYVVAAVNFGDDDFDEITISTNANFKSVCGFSPDNVNLRAIACKKTDNGCIISEKLPGGESMILVLEK